MTRVEVRRRAWMLARAWSGRYLLDGGSGGQNPAGAQCTNVPNTFWWGFGVPSLYGDARDWVGIHDQWRRWEEGDFLELRVGDVYVMSGGAGVGVLGHTGLVLDGTQRPFESFDQNWPDGAPCGFRRHPMALVRGVLRLRQLVGE